MVSGDLKCIAVGLRRVGRDDLAPAARTDAAGAAQQIGVGWECEQSRWVVQKRSDLGADKIARVKDKFDQDGAFQITVDDVGKQSGICIDVTNAHPIGERANAPRNGADVLNFLDMTKPCNDGQLVGANCTRVLPDDGVCKRRGRSIMCEARTLAAAPRAMCKSGIVEVKTDGAVATTKEAIEAHFLEYAENLLSVHGLSN